MRRLHFLPVLFLVTATSLPAYSPLVLDFDPSKHEFMIEKAFRTTDGNYWFIERTLNDSKKIFVQLPDKVKQISTSATYDAISFGSNGTAVLVDNSKNDKVIKWSSPTTGTTALTSVSITKKADILATDCSIGGDGTIACTLSGTFDNSVKIIPADLAKTAKVKDLKDNKTRDIKDEDFGRADLTLCKFDANASAVRVTDAGTTIWWQNNVFGKKLFLLKAKDTKPYRIDTTVEDVRFLADDTVIWYDHGFRGGEINVLKAGLLEEKTVETDPSDDPPEYRELDSRRILTFDGSFDDLHVTPNGTMLWWGDGKIKILYDDFYETAEALAEAEVAGFAGLGEDEQIAEILARVEVRHLDADPHSAAINAEGTVVWAQGDKVMVANPGEEVNHIDEKADRVTIADDGTIAWTGHSIGKYWVKLLVPGEREARVFKHWADGIDVLGTRTVLWWGRSDFQDDKGDDYITTYTAMFGSECYLPQPVAGENGCDTSGSLNQKIVLTGSYDPANLDAMVCYKKAELKKLWKAVQVPRDKDLKNKPTIANSSTEVANFTPDPTKHYQGRYEFDFCVNVDKTLSNCDRMGVEVVGEYTSPPEVECNREGGGGICGAASRNGGNPFGPAAMVSWGSALFALLALVLLGRLRTPRRP